jgi:signal transduction histidine kinase
MTSTTSRRLTGWLASVVLVAAVTGGIKLLHPHGPAHGLAVLYILVVLWVAVRWSPAFAFVASLLSAAAFDYFLLNPQYAYRLPNLADGESIGAFLATAIMASLLAGRLRRHVRETAQLAQEQAALRRIASLVARGLPPIEVFSHIGDEAARLLRAELALLGRSDADGLITIVAGWGRGPSDVPIGSRWPFADPPATWTTPNEDAAGSVQPEGPSDPLAEAIRNAGIRSSVVSSVVIDGRPWGVVLVANRATALGANAVQQIGDFSELLATAIRNADNQAELRASRARIVAAGDATRRRIERDLHDGAQQRLVSLALNVRAVETAVPPDRVELRDELSQVADGLISVLDELRELSHGVHPAVLAEGGLRPALMALAGRSPVAVELDVGVETRLPQHVEVTTYYVVSELLANAAKHAHASAIRVRVHALEDVLSLSINDDGVGGADSNRGSGLVGLRDRVEAIGGTFSMRSPLLVGTYVDVEIPTFAISGGSI